MESNQNSRPLPAEIPIDNGKMKVIRYRQEIEEIVHGTRFEVEK